MALDPRSLDMRPHPEGGWYRETWRHPAVVATDRGDDNPSMERVLEVSSASG